MFIERRKLGDTMWRLAGFVMLEYNQEAGEHGMFWGRGCEGQGMQKLSESVVISSWQSKITNLWEEGTLHSLCPIALFSCLPILQTDYAVPPPSEPLLGHSVFVLPRSPS